MNIKNPNLSGIYSWPVIIAFLILFFPVAIFLIYKRFSFDKSNIIKNAKTTKIFGFICIGFGFLYLLMGLTGNLQTTQDTMNPLGAVLFMLLLFGGGGIWLLFIAAKMKTKGEKYQKYIHAVVRQKQTSLDTIAATVGVSYETALKDLYRMLEDGYFKGFSINETSHELIFPAQKANNIQTKVMPCKNCGANNTVSIEAANECEYCGSPLEI